MPESEKTARPPLILLANEQEWAARSVESILGPRGFAVLRTSSGRQTIEAAVSANPDAIIIQSRLPDMDGMTVCRLLREDPRVGSVVPLILTTGGLAERTHSLAAMQAGAWAVFGQPLDAESLILTLDNFVRAKREIGRIREESLLDQVSGLYSLRGLAHRAREIGAEAFRRHDSLACIAIDADVPHAAGGVVDEGGVKVVQHLGAIIRRSARGSDAVGRLGQTEYAVIAPTTEDSGAIRLVERMQESLREAPMAVEGVRRTLQIRAGYCAVSDYAQSPVDAVEMLLRAGSALRFVRTRGEVIRAYQDVPSGYSQ